MSRRTLAKGAAWTIPAVAVAAPAAQAAASLPPVRIDFSAGACKIPGNSMGRPYNYDKGFVLWATFVNTTAGTVSIQVDKMFVGGVEQCLVGISELPCPMVALDCITLTAGESRTVGVFSNANSDSGSNLVVVEFTWFQGVTCAGTPNPEEQDAQVTGAPWSGDSGQGSCNRPAGACTAPPLAGDCEQD